ncbi:MAG: protease pro-enzyme activation domain-containing protein [Terracidiphilus sp.]
MATTMRFLKAFPLVVLACALLCSTALLAQHSTISPRITTDVNELSLATLRGNVPRLARAEFDQGEAAPSTQLTHMRLVLSRSSEQQAALDAYLAQLQDKSSPNYHKWLTPVQFGQLYGPTDSDIAALVAWLESHGFQVDPISPGHTNIAFSGSVSQVEEAFHTSIHSFLVNGGQAGEQQFYSNTLDPQIPSALASVVKGVAHLNTVRPRPHLHRGTTGKFNPETKRLEPASALSANGARPELTETSPNLTFGSGTTNNPYLLYLVPADAATIYDTPNSFNANFTSGTSYNGAGVKIGIGGDAIINASIVAAYRSQFLGNSTQPTLNYCTTSASCSTTPGSGYHSDDADEAYIDTELSGGLAPGATIYYYASPDLDTAIDAAITANVVDIFSLSFGECEQDNGASENALINNYWSTAAAAGIAVTVSSGDSGSAGCDYPSTNSGKNVPDASGGLAVSGYASTPYNIAVGGTDFYPLVNSFSSYVNVSEGSTSTYYRTAKGYIPESTWNDSTYNNTTISADEPLSATGYFPTKDNNIVAGSGGASVIYPKPSWQTGTGVPSDGARDLPDVSFMAGNGFYYAMWLVCDATYNCANISESGVDAYGGTSTAAPAFAGILALVQQKSGSRLGMPGQVLYGLYTGANSNLIFHDQNKVGNNSVPCTENSPNCVLNAAGYYFESGYNTNTGYDLATGMGSVDATQLVNYWNSSTGSAPATIGITPSPNPVTTVQSLTVTVSVSGGSGTPTGAVTLSGGSYNLYQTIGSGTCTSASSCVFTIGTGNLPIGIDTLTVTYGGNSTYAVATNTTTVTVNGLTAVVTANPSATSIKSNQQLTVTGTVACTGTCTGSPTPSGTVTLTGGGLTQSLTATLSGTGSYSITTPYNSLAGAASPGLLDTLTVTYGGNSIYNAGETGTTSVTVTYVPVLTPTVTVTPAASSIDSSQTLSVTVAVSGSGATPTGYVTLTSSSYSSGPQTLSTTGGCTAALCTITIPAGSLSNGSDTLTATYSGDANYSSGTPGTASVTVTTSVFALAATTPASIAPGASTTSTVTVSSATHYTGTIMLTCASTSGPTNTSSDAPSCMVGSTTVTLVSGVPTGTGQVTITVYTTAATSDLLYPKLPGRGWTGAGGGVVLAFLLFLGIPARRRSWRSMLGILIVMAALGSLTACGGSGGGGGGGSTGTPGTTAGTYTFTVTGTGNLTVTPPPTATFTVTVN